MATARSRPQSSTPSHATRTCRWCYGRPVGSEPGQLWEIARLQHRTGPVPRLGGGLRPASIDEPASIGWACGGCAPLVEAGDTGALATRAVLASMINPDSAPSMPHADMVALFDAVQRVLLRKVPPEAGGNG